MYKQTFYTLVPYRKVGDPSLGIGPPLEDVYINHPELHLPYGEAIHSVNMLYSNVKDTATSTFTIILGVNIRSIYHPYTPITMEFDGMTGALLGYSDPIVAPPGYIYSEVVQSIDGSLWASTMGHLIQLDRVSGAAPDQSQWILASFFEIPADQRFHEVHHPMIDKSRDIIIMSASPASVDGRYILVNQLSTGKLLRRVWVSGPVSQIIQEDDRRCFVICTNGILNVVDFTTGAVLSTTSSPAVHTVDGQAIYAWAPSLRRLLAFNFVDANRAFLGGPPFNADGSSPDTITGYYPVPLATNITRPIPLKPPRKGRTVPLLIRAVGGAGEAIPSLPLTVTATEPGELGAGGRITDGYGYAVLNFTGTAAGMSEVTVSVNVDDGAVGIVNNGGAGGTGGAGSGSGDGSDGSTGGTGVGSSAPVLTAASGAQIGPTTASGSVSTNQGNGLLFTLFSTNATATAAEVKAGQIQNVTTTGAQQVTVTGLTAETIYYPHYLHRNNFSLESAVATGASFTTPASGTGTGTGGGISAPPIDVGSQITTLSVENTSGSAATNQPFTIGHAFLQGHLPASGAAVTLHLPDNSTISAQLNVKALHGDGSVRHAIISGVIPSIAAGASVALSMKRASAPGAGSNVGLPASLPSAQLSIGGTLYTAAPTSSTPHTSWFAGPVASDFVFNVQFVNGSGTPHPTLTAQFSVRAFATGHVRVDYVIEHCQAYASTADITYDATLFAGGSSVYTRAGLVHTPAGRWKRTIWQGGASSLHVKHNIPYLLDSRQVPNYDRSITISETYLNGLAADLSSGKFNPMGFGRFRPYMPDYGGRPDIGLMPDSHAALLLSMDKRAWDLVMAAGDIGGSWPMCRRDDSTGPGRGYPLSVINFPYASIYGSVGDCNNPATGNNEHLPSLVSATTGTPDSSHQPDIYYLPYLLSGDYFYLEGLHFCGTYNHYQDNPYYREFEKAHVHGDQVRGQGWSLRTMAECAAITPEDHYLKSHFVQWYNNNMKWYLDTYLDAPKAAYANQLSFIANGSSIEYSVNGGTLNGMAPWMDDFFTQALGHGYELLGLDTTKRLLTWKAKFQIGRMNDPAVCVTNACIYALGVRNSATSPFFGTLAECFAFSTTSESQYACGAPERLAMHPGCLPGDIGGYPESESGYPSNYQPALAVCVDIGYPGGAQAWAKFMARPTKPNYGLYGPQFAVVPR